MVDLDTFLTQVGVHFSIDKSFLTPTARLVADLDLDSLGLLLLIIQIEEWAGVASGAPEPNLHTLQDAYSYYCLLIGDASTPTAARGWQ